VTLKTREKNRRNQERKLGFVYTGTKEGKGTQGVQNSSRTSFHLSNINHEQEGTNDAIMAPAEGDGN
jgi:hypothetical protein